jgi:tetratricopeptide (TPR) repeat protein
MMKKTFYLLLLLMALASCHEKGVTERMNEIDSLVIQELYDSAYASVMRIGVTDLSEMDDSAHYYLLLTQTSILTRHPDTLVMLDSIVIPYYINVRNHEKLAEAYYYKAYRMVRQKNYPEATHWYKKAEEQSLHSSNHRLRYKIAESLATINEIVGSHTMQLDYAQKALKIAKAAQNKEWIAYAYCRMSFAHSRLHHKDSAMILMNKAIPYSRYIKKRDLPTFLTNAAYVYKYTMPDSAKKYLIMSMEQEESSVTMQHLADIYYIEGNKEEAYRLWKKALTVNDGVPKDNVLHNILDYDTDHGHTDHVCETVNEILHIKDSMLNSLRNDTIKDLQLRFDHEVAMRRQEQVMGNWQKGVLFAVILIVLLAAYIVIRRVLEKMKMQDIQMQINDHISHIRELEATGEDAHDTIDSLNNEIKKLTEEESPKLKQGRMLYDQIIEGKPIKDWTIKEKRLFINYYMAINYRTVRRLKKMKRREPLTDHNLLYLLLMEIKDQNEDEVAKILSISENGMRTLKSRTKPVE